MLTGNKAEAMAMGIFNKYANMSLISAEKEAWAEAVKEKHTAEIQEGDIKCAE